MKQYKIYVLRCGHYLINSDKVIFGDAQIHFYFRDNLFAVFPTANTVIESITDVTT